MFCFVVVFVLVLLCCLFLSSLECLFLFLFLFHVQCVVCEGVLLACLVSKHNGTIVSVVVMCFVVVVLSWCELDSMGQHITLLLPFPFPLSHVVCCVLCVVFSVCLGLGLGLG